MTLAAALAAARISPPPPSYFCSFLKSRQGVGRASSLRAVCGGVLFSSVWLSGQIHCGAGAMASHNSLYTLQMWIAAHEAALTRCFWISPPDPG